jgi:hypothetical protein
MHRADSYHEIQEYEEIIVSQCKFLLVLYGRPNTGISASPMVIVRDPIRLLQTTKKGAQDDSG